MRLHPLLSAIARGALSAFLIRALGVGLKYGMQILLARWLGSLEYGKYAFIYTWAALLAVFATLGFTSASLKFIPLLLTREAWGLVRGYIHRARQLAFMSGIFLALAWGIFMWLLGGSYSDTGLLLYGGILIPLIGLMNVQMEILRGLKRIVEAYFPPMIIQSLIVILLTCYALIHSVEPLSQNALRFLLIGTLAVVALQSIELRRFIPKPVKLATPLYQTKDWLKVAIPLLVVAGSLVLLNQFDILMVGVLMGPQEAGIYTAVTKTAALVGFVLVAVNAVVAPMISELYAKKDEDGLRQLAQWATWLTFVPSLAFTLGIWLWGHFILGWFGSDFDRGYWALTILTTGQLINASVGPVGYLASLTGLHNETARTYAISAVINILLNALLIPKLGLSGAAIATTTTMILWNAALYHIVTKHLSVRPGIWRIILR